MNVWTCAIRRVEGRRRLSSPVFSPELDETGAIVSDGIDVRVGVRPHDIELVPHGRGDGTGRGRRTARPGDVIRLRVDGLLDELMRMTVPADAPIAAGQATGFRLRRDRLHPFDARSGRRLAVERVREAGI
jgi:hypothetical protein